MGAKCCKPESYDLGDIVKKNIPIGGKKFDEESLDATTDGKSGFNMKNPAAAIKAAAEKKAKEL
jgi:hypothetical protein